MADLLAAMTVSENWVRGVFFTQSAALAMISNVLRSPVLNASAMSAERSAVGLPVWKAATASTKTSRSSNGMDCRLPRPGDGFGSIPSNRL